MRASLRTTCLFAVIMATASPAFAAEATAATPWPTIEFKGFGTLGAARSDSDDSQFVRDLSQPDGLGKHWSGKTDTMLGLQANLTFSPRSSAVMQGLVRYRYDGSWRPELNLAFLRHDLAPDFTLRAGRMGTEFYLQADARQVGYANTMLRPPTDYFGPIVVSYIDGIDASLTGDTGYGLLRGKLFAGWAAEKTPVIKPHTWDLRGSRMAGAYLDYLNGPWQLRVSRSKIRFQHQQPLDAAAGFPILTLAPELNIKGRHATYDSIGLIYDEGRLQVQGQLSSIRYDTSAYEDTRAGYLMLAYRVGPVTPYLGYSRTRSEQASLTTPTIPALQFAIRQFMAETHSDQETYTLGARWDFQRNLALKAQLDMIRGDRDSRFPQRYTEKDWNGHLNVLSLALDFVF
ncbi:hypothetical protein [Azonexus sp.]|uniref:hypothetical protein n=1 Tax=Azonexus sp. TaxID=1872668 RepID=UPI0035B1BE32